MVLLGVLEAEFRVEHPQDDHLTAGVQGGIGTAGVDAAPVEPGSHVHRSVGAVEGKVHHHVVGGEHLIDVIQRHAAGPARGAGRVQPEHLLIDVAFRGNRLAVGLTLNIVLVALAAYGDAELRLPG